MTKQFAPGIMNLVDALPKTAELTAIFASSAKTSEGNQES